MIPFRPHSSPLLKNNERKRHNVYIINFEKILMFLQCHEYLEHEFDENSAMVNF